MNVKKLLNVSVLSSLIMTGAFAAETNSQKTLNCENSEVVESVELNNEAKEVYNLEDKLPFFLTVK